MHVDSCDDASHSAFSMHRTSAELILAALAQVSALAASSPWGAYLAFNADVSWRGYATRVDPSTCVPTLPGIEYTHFIAAEDENTKVRTTTSLGDSGPDGKSIESIGFVQGNADIDLDGSYSCEHTNGLGLAALLSGMDDECIVVEHSLATSDDERRRCLLSYEATSGSLKSVLLLVERKGQAADPAPQGTLYSLCGTWRGDACVRSPTKATTSGRTKGFGNTGFGQAKSGGKKPSAESGGGDSLGSCRTAVFKAKLTYAWDGATNVARQLCVTSAFGEGGDLDAIRSTGSLVRAEGDYGEYESVSFVGDATRPTLLFLPSACHVLAPQQLPMDAKSGPFNMEFGAVLEPGESFGWRGYLPSDDKDTESDVDAEGYLPPLDPEGDTTAPRLARISRLYSGVGAFVSGSTSLCTAE